MDHAEKARALFLEGYNCAQAVLCAFDDLTGLDRETSARLASSFGGGMGRMREVCGTVSGALLVLGILCGYADPGDRQAKTEHYHLVQEFARRFREMNRGTTRRQGRLRIMPPAPAFGMWVRLQSSWMSCCGSGIGRTNRHRIPNTDNSGTHQRSSRAAQDTKSSARPSTLTTRVPAAPRKVRKGCRTEAGPNCIQQTSFTDECLSAVRHRLMRQPLRFFNI